MSVVESASLYELEIGWAETTDEQRRLHWELLACDDVCGVFRTAHDDVLAVLFSGDRRRFRAWARSLAPEVDGAHRHRLTAPTRPKGALQ